jgi:hypothetical protein
MNPLNGIERSTSDRVTPSRDKIVNPFNGIERILGSTPEGLIHSMELKEGRRGCNLKNLSMLESIQWN